MGGVSRLAAPWRRALIGSRSVWPLFVVAGLVAILATIAAPFLFLWMLARRGARKSGSLASGLALRGYVGVIGRRTERAARELLAGTAPKDVPTVVAMYRQMQDVEIEGIHRAIGDVRDVEAWYCPTAFWPSVTALDVPHLICVPDVVLADFPATFSGIGGDRLLETYRQIEATLRRGSHFVTYSRYVRDSTLVRRFGVDPARVSIVAHGALRLDPLIRVVGSPDPEAATDALARDIVRAVVNRVRPPLRPGALGEDAQFLFYASQFRPHKNVVNLLRACAHLLRRRYAGCRLVLTGNPAHAPEIGEFVSRLDLHEEVLFLHGLSPQELAAFYRRAALAVNPSLFEGGLPFTFSEAVSVGTPVVMARIPVTEEAIADHALAADMLFDPYDWRDMADRIEWALAHREALLERQRTYFAREVATRTWAHALDDYLALLDRVAAGWQRAAA
jgi:glycosyltransferase involved in cell wall biosynthesis